MQLFALTRTVCVFSVFGVIVLRPLHISSRGELCMEGHTMKVHAENEEKGEKSWLHRTWIVAAACGGIRSRDRPSGRARKRFLHRRGRESTSSVSSQYQRKLRVSMLSVVEIVRVCMLSGCVSS